MADPERRNLFTIALLVGLGFAVLVGSIRIAGNAALHQTYDEAERAPSFYILHRSEDGVWRPSILEKASTQPNAWGDRVPTVLAPTPETIENFLLTAEALEQLEVTRKAEAEAWTEWGVLLSGPPVVTNHPNGSQDVQIWVALGESSGRFQYQVSAERGELIPIEFGRFTKREGFIGTFLGSIAAAAIVAAICFVLDGFQRRRASRRMARGRSILWGVTAICGIGAFGLFYFSGASLIFGMCFLFAVCWIVLSRDRGAPTPSAHP